MNNVKAFSNRIARANSAADFDKLEAALTRLCENGIFNGREFMDLDHALLDERIAFEWSLENERA